MFTNLKRTLREKGITLKQYSEFLEVSEKTVKNKLRGTSDFTYKEFKKTCLLLSEYNADYLFKEENKKEMQLIS